MRNRRANEIETADNSDRPPQSISFDGPVRVAIIVLGFAVSLALLLGLFWLLGTVLLILFAGILLAVALRGLSDTLAEKTGLSKGWSLGIVLVTLVLVLTAAGWAMAPNIAAQFQQLTEQIPQAIDQLYGRIAEYDWGRRFLDEVPSGEELLSPRTGFLGYVPDYFTTLAGGVIMLIFVLFIGLYLAVDPDLYRTGLLRLFPADHRPRAEQVLDETALTLRRWLLGRAVSMAAVGVMTALGLWLLDMPLALILGLLAAMLDIIPNIGPIIAAIPGVLMGFLISPEMAGYVILVYVVVQQIESYLVTPLVQQYSVSLPPVMTLLAQVLMALAFGAMGLLLATPLAAVLLVLVKMLYVQQTLGEDVELFRGHEPEEPATPNSKIVLGSEAATPPAPKT